MSATIIVTCELAEKVGPYVAALKAAGVPSEAIRVLLPDEPGESFRELGARAAGVLLCGGPDVEPHRYGETPLPGIELDLIPRLDAIELDVLAGARERGVPVWGICRGLQVLNVYFGGSLWQDLPSQRSGAEAHRTRGPKDAMAHPVEPHEGSAPLAEALGVEPLYVNSRHHQGIKTLGDDLVAVATSPDGLIEAVSHRRDDWWVEAVQWHPENLLAHEGHRMLGERFRAAIAARGKEAAP